MPVSHSFVVTYYGPRGAEIARLLVPEGTLVSEVKKFTGTKEIYKCFAKERQEELENLYRFIETGFALEFTFDTELEKGELEKRISNYNRMEQVLIEHHGWQDYIRKVRTDRRIKYDLLK